MWPSNAKRGLSRQRPVSCHFCRTRKLRCSRQFPCSNCTARGLNCQPNTSQAFPVESRSSKEDEPTDSNSELLARLQRLEEIVMNQSGQGPTAVTAVSYTSAQTRSNTQQRRTQPATADSEWFERECMSQYSSVSSILYCRQKKYTRR